MTLYRMLLVRREQATVYVEADSQREAEEAAWELADTSEWWTDFGESEVEDIDEIDSIPEGERYWTGGEEGRWVQT